MNTLTQSMVVSRGDEKRDTFFDLVETLETIQAFIPACVPPEATFQLRLMAAKPVMPDLDVLNRLVDAVRFANQAFPDSGPFALALDRCLWIRDHARIYYRRRTACYGCTAVTRVCECGKPLLALIQHRSGVTPFDVKVAGRVVLGELCHSVDDPEVITVSRPKSIIVAGMASEETFDHLLSITIGCFRQRGYEVVGPIHIVPEPSRSEAAKS